MDSFFNHLAAISNTNSPLNFGRHHTPEELQDFFRDTVKWSWVRTQGDDLVVVITVTHENELGFAINLDYVRMGSLFVFRTVRDIVEKFPMNEPNKLWCRVQQDNTVIQNALKKLNFREDGYDFDEGVQYVFWSICR